MAIASPVTVIRPTDQSENIHMEETHPLQQESLLNSNHNSSNLNHNLGITVHLSEGELKESPKSPSNSNGVSPETNEIQGKQNASLEPPQLSASKYVSKIDGNKGHNSGEDSGELAGAQANQNVKDGANEHHKEARKTIPQQSTSDNSPTKLACQSDINSEENHNDGDSQNANKKQEKEQELNQNGNKGVSSKKLNSQAENSNLYAGDHQDKNETAILKIKVNNSSNGTTNQQSKQVTEDHTNINNKNMTGKLLHNLQAPHDHSTAPYNNAKFVSQNEHEKGKHVMQEDGNGQNEKQNHMGNKLVDPKSLPLSRYTLVGKFTNSTPKMEVIKKSFVAQTHLIGTVNIAHYNSRHIYIDFDKQADHINVLTKQKMFITGHSMKIQMWNPEFKPEDETPVVPIWITLHELPWHCYYMDTLTLILSPIGKALYLDSASMQKTRGGVAKVRIQIDLTKERPRHVWLGFSEKDPTREKWQIIDYEETQGRKRNNNHTQNQDQGKAKNALMQIPKPPPPVIDVDDDHCLNNDTLSPIIPSVVANEVCGGRMVVKENPTNMQKREPKERGLTHAPATTVKAPQKMLNQTQQQIPEANQMSTILQRNMISPRGLWPKIWGTKPALVDK
ncbi:hypothetical protein KY285_022210 [Solanum tuberosum]|nr:hypothetical protein KY289_020537 [Solanum tuberosum]KAH0695113.1 hypothetical protein KY285_022210 [Solanum tuberosum]